MFSLSKYLIHRRMKSEILAAASRHARKYGMQDAFLRDFAKTHDEYESLLEWDLLDEEIINEIENIKTRYSNDE